MTRRCDGSRLATSPPVPLLPRGRSRSRNRRHTEECSKIGGPLVSSAPQMPKALPRAADLGRFLGSLWQPDVPEAITLAASSG